MAVAPELDGVTGEPVEVHAGGPDGLGEPVAGSSSTARAAHTVVRVVGGSALSADPLSHCGGGGGLLFGWWW